MTKPNPPSPRSSRRFRKLLWVAGTFLALLLVLRFLVLGPAALGLSRWAAERYGGYHLEAESLRTDGWTYVEVDGLDLRALQPQLPLRSLHASRVRVEVSSLPRLLRRPLGELRTLQGRDLTFDLDLTRRAEPPAEKEPFELPSHLPPLSIDTFKGEVKLEAGRRVEIDGETLT
ncbi:MAG: hypothetical protein KDD47_13910, partial [Acidobacteria bacterium]|nr:hypothetical protein [Acidobacteriota bacterium]